MIDLYYKQDGEQWQKDDRPYTSKREALGRMQALKEDGYDVHLQSRSATYMSYALFGLMVLLAVGLACLIFL